jgi:SOS-response transcriptional repressor LexA
MVVLNDSDAATFKQLALVGDALQLRLLNRRYKSVPLGTSRIIGVVRVAIHRFR